MMKRYQSSSKRRPLTDLVDTYDEFNATNQQIKSGLNCCAKNNNCVSILSTNVDKRDRLVYKPKQLLRFSDRQREYNGTPIDCIHNKSYLQHESELVRELICGKQSGEENQTNCLNVNSKILHNTNKQHHLEKEIRKHKHHHHHNYRQSRGCCYNRKVAMLNDDTVNAIFASDQLSDVSEALRSYEQHQQMIHGDSDKHNHFFDLDNEDSIATTTTQQFAKHKSDALNKQLKRANLNQQILKFKNQRQQHHNLIDLNRLNRQDLCHLAKNIRTEPISDLNLIKNPSLRSLETCTDANTKHYSLCNCHSETNNLELDRNRRSYQGNIVTNLDLLKDFGQQQTEIKSIDGDSNIDDYFFRRTNQVSRASGPATGASSLVNSHSSVVKTTSTTIKTGDDLKSTSLRVISEEKSVGEIRSASQNSNGNQRNNSHNGEAVNTSYGAGAETNNKTNSLNPTSKFNYSDGNNGVDHEKENAISEIKAKEAFIEKKLSQQAFKSTATTLPASLKRIGNIFSRQLEPDELISELKQLNDQDKARLEEKRKSYKPMNWKHIANIYKHQKPIKTLKDKKQRTAKEEPNTTNNYHNKFIIDNPMYLNGKLGKQSVGSWNNGNKPKNKEIHLDHSGQTVRSRLKGSCLCQLMVNSIHNLFPILHAFDDYSIPADLLGDLFTGLTIAILQVPQGMAYGMLAGVDPIYGLYVSLIPVLVMAFMSKSRHVSYGTFAIISILLASSTESIRSKINMSQRSLLVTDGQNQLTEDGDNKSNLQQLNQASRIGVKQTQIITSLASNDPLILTLPNENSMSGQHSSLLINTQIAPTNIEILTTICITVAIIQLLMALLRLGHLAVIFSDQLVSSFTCASAFHVLTSQLAGLFDLDTPAVSEGLFKVCRTWWHVFQAITHNNNNSDVTNYPNTDFNRYTAILSLISIIFLLGVKEILEPCLRARYTKMVKCLPSELILMTCIVFSSWYWQFNVNFGIRIVGFIPTGLPAPKLPPVELIPYALQDAVTIALISFAMNLSLAQVYAKRFRYKMDSNQELFALGSSNLVGSFFSCFPCASSLSRSALQSNLNVRSPLAPIFSCAIVFSMIAYLAPVLHDLPKSTLSCIIIIALKSVLMQCRDLAETWRLSKLDASTWLVTFWAVIALGVTYGLVIGIVSSLLTIFFRILTPNYTILGQLPGTEIFVDKSAFEDCEEIDEVRIFRFNSPLCYMNRTMFRARVESALPNVYKKFNCLKLFCPNTRKIDLERDQILGDCDQISAATTANINCSHNINYGGICNMRKNNTKVRYFIIDCSALAYCDHAGANLLLDLIQELEEHKVTVYLAACPIKLVFMFERLGSGSILESHVYPTISAAVNQAKYLRDSSSRRNNINSLSIYCHQ